MSLPPGDITRQSWIEQNTPPAWGPYIRLARLDRPIGTWLLLLPCWWSMLLARPDWVTALKYGLLFAIGAVVMRGAGCTLNDWLDRDLDGQVARTRTRPLPSGEITSRNSLIFLGLQLGIALVILLQFNAVTIGLGVAALGLVFPYPLMKRITWWPQAFLGLTFNWGALMGWCAITGTVSATAIALYLGGIFWTLGYDTIYAHQDVDDDALIGVRSTARRLGTYSRQWVAGFYGLAVLGWGIAGWLGSAGIGWFAGLILVAFTFGRQIILWKSDDPTNCLARFRDNRMIGIILLGAALVSFFW
jgi:4-hydroxybenzoate polyprenyltransferase